MARLISFDYKSPYFYMVTLKRLKELADFSAIGPNGLVENEITRAFNTVIQNFHRKWRCLDEISPFVVMPDHIHLLIKIKDIPDRVALGVLVSQLTKALRAAYWDCCGRRRNMQDPMGSASGASASGAIASSGSASGAAASGASASGAFASSGSASGAAASGASASGASASSGSASGASAPPPVFEAEWHDWIVKKRGQLAAFRRYIRENPTRAWLRRQNARYFGRVQLVNFCDKTWFAYGNTALLDLPALIPFKCSRRIVENSPDWNAFTETAARIGPGGAGISTFMSPCEKFCGNLIAKADGNLIVLCPEGFGPRWHPTREKERFCAQGRMLFLSLYSADTRKPDNATLYRRCHEMGDLIREHITSASRRADGRPASRPANLDAPSALRRATQFPDAAARRRPPASPCHSQA